MAAVKDHADATVDILVLPPDAIEDGFGASGTNLRGVTASDGDSFAGSIINTVAVSPHAVDTDDRRQPLVFGHELGHVLMGLPLPLETGQPLPTQGEEEHSAVTYHLMYYATGATDRKADPKRLTWVQQLAARCESGSPDDDVTASLCAGLPVRFDRSNAPILYRP